MTTTQRNLPGPTGAHLKGEGVSQATKPSYICGKCQATFKWYKGVKLIGNGIALCENHNPAFSAKQAVNS